MCVASTWRAELKFYWGGQSGFLKVCLYRAKIKTVDRAHSSLILFVYEEWLFIYSMTIFVLVGLLDESPWMIDKCYC